MIIKTFREKSKYKPFYNCQFIKDFHSWDLLLHDLRNFQFIAEERTYKRKQAHTHTWKNLGVQTMPPTSHSLHEQMPQRAEMETLSLDSKARCLCISLCV